jgi:hypothetical protein
MELLLRIEQDGQPIAAMPLAKDCAMLMCSWEAMRELMRQLTSIGAICKRCGLAIRSAEADDGVCIEGVGCRGDEMLNGLLELPAGMRQVAFGQAALEIEKAFRAKPFQGGEEEVDF